MTQAVQIIPDGTEVVDRLGLGHDVELAALIELESDMTGGLEAGPELGPGLAHPLGDSADLSVMFGDERHDAVSLTQLVGPQNDPVIPVERHRI